MNYDPLLTFLLGSNFANSTSSFHNSSPHSICTCSFNLIIFIQYFMNHYTIQYSIVTTGAREFFLAGLCQKIIASINIRWKPITKIDKYAVCIMCLWETIFGIYNWGIGANQIIFGLGMFSYFRAKGWLQISKQNDQMKRNVLSPYTGQIQIFPFQARCMAPPPTVFLLKDVIVRILELTITLLTI